MISIRYFQDSDKPQWDAYIHNHPDSTVFHLTAWKEVVEKTFGHKSYYLIALNKEEGEKSHEASSNAPPSSSISPHQSRIVGVLPIFRVKSFLFGDYLVSVPFAEIGGPISDEPDVEHLLLDMAQKLAAELNCDYLELRNRMPNLSPANPKYKKKIEIWRKLPLAATKIIGPRIAKYLA